MNPATWCWPCQCAPPAQQRALRSEVDDLVSLKTPFELLAIGYWYEDFEQVSDEEVVELLERSRAAEWGGRGE